MSCIGRVVTDKRALSKFEFPAVTFRRCDSCLLSAVSVKRSLNSQNFEFSFVSFRLNFQKPAFEKTVFFFILAFKISTSNA